MNQTFEKFTEELIRKQAKAVTGITTPALLRKAADELERQEKVKKDDFSMAKKIKATREKSIDNWSATFAKAKTHEINALMQKRGWNPILPDSTNAVLRFTSVEHPGHYLDVKNGKFSIYEMNKTAVIEDVYLKDAKTGAIVSPGKFIKVQKKA